MTDLIDTNRVSGPLQDLVVVEVANTFMAPYCTQLMAQMGARIIKVEPPKGDIARYIDDKEHRGLGSLFLNANRGKESIVLDLKDPTDRSRLLAIIRKCDVFIHNLRPKTRRSLGLDYEDVAAMNKACVYCSTQGFGSDGRYANLPAYDDIIQALTGIASIQGAARIPQYVRTVIADKTTGLMALIAVLSALHVRAQTGLGQSVEVPMFECMVSYLLLEQQGSWVYKQREGRPGYERSLSPERKPYPTSDGYVSIMPYSNDHWRTMFDVIDRPDLRTDPRFATITDRTQNIDELYELIGAAVAHQSTAFWLQKLRNAGIPAGEAKSLEEVFDDPHLADVGFFEAVEGALGRDLIQTRLPWTYSRNLPKPARRAPLLGEHTDAVLAEFGANHNLPKSGPSAE